MNLKQFTLALMLFVLGVSPMGAAVFDLEKTPLGEVLEKIGEKYNVVFSYNSNDLKKITVDFEFKAEEVLEAAVNRVLINTGLQYKYLGANFFIIHKNTKAGHKKLRKIQRKIQQIERLGETSDLKISGKRNTIHNIFSTAKKLEQMSFVNGTITDEGGQMLVGATVLVVGTDIGTATGLDGKYQLKIPLTAKTLEIAYTGYSSQQVTLKGQPVIDVQLVQGIALTAVTVFGSRGKPRTSFDSPVPVDHIAIDALTASGKNTLDQQLMFKVPSYNATQQPISDASAHFNPAGLRGLLPSRTLVLVNGKRKNSSALVYSYITSGRGEVGVDMQSIAPDAIESVEILRDGAAAQYGSDAVAGVINLVLKKKSTPFLNVAYSTTSQGDGTNFKAASGFSTNLNKKGYANFTLSYLNQRRSQRAGIINDPKAEADYWNNPNFTLADFQSYLSRNPSAGSQVGLPDMSSVNFSVNTAYTLDAATNTELYAFGTLMNRTGSSPQFARTPYWVSGFEAIYPDQDYFLPEMAPKIQDNTLSVGIKSTIKGWKVDLSSTVGRNKIDYYITNSFNQSLGADSPKEFYNGAHIFRHLVNNIDALRTFNTEDLEALTIAFGIEQRTENFKTKAGEFASYGDGSPDILDRIGSESFSGFKPENASSNYRNNLGFYTEITADFTKKFLLGGALRYENYSDFGGNISWKLNACLKAIENKLNIRGSVSNGFRAPALHQIYYTAITTTLTQEGIVQNRIFNNHHPALHTLGIPRLTPETSFNLGAGFTYKITDKIGFATDLYQIGVADRIVLSGQVGKTGVINSPIDQLLNSINTSSAGFFLNAVNTTTRGIDVVLNVDNTKIGTGSLKGSISANFNKTTVDAINLPKFIEDNHLENNILSREDVSRIETWLPQQKIAATSTYAIHKWSATLSLFYYGAVRYKHPTVPQYDARYSGKMLTYINFSYIFTDKVKMVMGVNNLFNVYPDTFIAAYNGVPGDRNLDFVGRFKYPWQATQFGIDGSRFFTSLSFKF